MLSCLPRCWRNSSNKSEPSELLALVAMPADDLDRIPLSPDLLVVAFDRPASPGNLGSIIRSCDALGAHGVIMTGHSVDLYDPETISASVGSLFALPVVRLPSPARSRRGSSRRGSGWARCRWWAAMSRATRCSRRTIFAARRCW